MFFSTAYTCRFPEGWVEGGGGGWEEFPEGCVEGGGGEWGDRGRRGILNTEC